MRLEEVILGIKTLSPEDYKVFREHLPQLNEEVIALRYETMLQAFEDMGEALTAKDVERIIIENHGAFWRKYLVEYQTGRRGKP
jgi:hypothetical protein